MAANILRELLDRPVASLGLAAERHQHDVVEIAAQTAAQFLRRTLR
jgi:hypothetical protein